MPSLPWAFPVTATQLDQPAAEAPSGQSHSPFPQTSLPLVPRSLP
jgi:hypothetical protein